MKRAVIIVGLGLMGCGGAKGGEGLNAALEPAIDRAMRGMKNAS